MRISLAVIMLLAACNPGGLRTVTRLDLGPAPKHAAVAAAAGAVYVITGDAGGNGHVTAYDRSGRQRWRVAMRCPRFQALPEGLVCVGKHGVSGLNLEGKKLWAWKAPSPVQKIRFEGVRLTLDLVNGARHTFITAHGLPEAPGPKSSDTRRFTAKGRITIAQDAGALLLARRYRNGELLWRDLALLWPRLHVLPFHLALQTTRADGSHTLALMDPRTRTIIAEAPWPHTASPTRLFDSPETLVASSSAGFVALRKGHTAVGKLGAGGSFAPDRSRIFSLARVAGRLLLRSMKLSPTVAKPAPKAPFFLDAGARFHGAFRDAKGKLTHLEIKVRRWHPDIAYAWRTTGPWTVRRFAPRAAGDRGYEPSFDGEQIFSPMPLWLSPDFMAELGRRGEANIGKIGFKLEGRSYHRLRRFSSAGQAGEAIDVPVWVVSRKGESERLWVTPHGDRPMILKAEKRGGLFYLASVVLPPSK